MDSRLMPAAFAASEERSILKPWRGTEAPQKAGRRLDPASACS